MAQLDGLPALLVRLAQPANPAQLQADTQALQALYPVPGTFDRLQQIALGDGQQQQVPRDARVLAGLVMKNEMVGRWRGRTTVPEDDKQRIRERFFQFLSVDDTPIATTQFWIMSKISRIDYPRAWEDMMPALLNSVIASAQAHLSALPSQSPPQQGQQHGTARTALLNALRLLSRLVKEWGTVRLPVGTRVLDEWAGLWLPVLVPLQEALNARTGGDGAAAGETELAVWCLKCLSRIAVWEQGRPRSAPSISSSSGAADGASAEAPAGGAASRATIVFTLAVGQLGSIVAARSALLAQGAARPGAAAEVRARLDGLTWLLKTTLKFLRRMQEASPGAFATLSGATPVVLDLWRLTRAHLESDDAAAGEGDDAEAGSEWPERFRIHTLLMVKDLLPTWEAKHQDVMTPSFIADLFAALVDRALLLSPADLEALGGDPEGGESEEWCVRELSGNEQWTFELRPCAERVLLALNLACRNRPDQIMQTLMQAKLSEALSTPPTTALALRRKEAVYAAAGRLVRFVVQDGGVPVAALVQALVGECQVADAGWRPLKRRIGWLIGELVDADDELAASPLPWQALLHLLTDCGPASDPGVRLTAAGALRQCMDLWELDPSVFAPFIPQIAQGLLSLLDELETLEGKRRVLMALEVMVEREGLDITPYAPGIAGKVPELWAGAGRGEGEWLFKGGLLTLVTKLVDALKTDATQITPMCIQLLGESMSGSAKQHLDEDALILWQALLRNAPALADAQLAGLVPAAIELLANDRDQLARALAVLDSYVLLDGRGVFEGYAAQICQVLGDVLATSNTGHVIVVLSSLQLYIQAVPFDLWAPAAVNTGLIKRLLEGATAPKVGTALPHFTSLLARVVLASPDSFFPLLRQANVDPSAFMELWWAAFDRLSLASVRKRVALASAALCATAEQVVLARFGELLNVFIDVLAELKETEEDTGGDSTARSSLSLHWKRGADAPVLGDSEGTAEGERLKELHARDPVYSASLKGFLRTQLANTAGLAGYVDPSDPAFVELQGYLGS